MSNEFNKDLCEIRKEQVNKTLERHEIAILKQDEKIDDITKIVYETTTQVKALTSGISTLTSTIKWGFGLFISVIIALATIIVGVIVK